MNEYTWLSDPDGPRAMLEYIVGRASKRKVRLYSCASVRRIWHLLLDDRSRNAIVSAEDYADGSIGKNDLFQVLMTAQAVITDLHGTSEPPNEALLTAAEGSEVAVQYAAGVAKLAAANDVSDVVKAAGEAELAVGCFASREYSHPDEHAVWRKAASDEMEAQMPLIRCVFGNPFRPVTLDPNSLTPIITHLAQAIYDDRTFDRLPILADLLQESGYDQADVLQHLRSGGEHVRGCWALDLILGKE